MNNVGFMELKSEMLCDVNGGFTGWRGGLCTFAGSFGLLWSLPIFCVNPGAGMLLAGGSLSLLDQDEN